MAEENILPDDFDDEKTRFETVLAGFIVALVVLFCVAGTALFIISNPPKPAPKTPSPPSPSAAAPGPAAR